MLELAVLPRHKKVSSGEVLLQEKLRGDEVVEYPLLEELELSSEEMLRRR